jgi:hypothetical protein
MQDGKTQQKHLFTQEIKHRLPPFSSQGFSGEHHSSMLTTLQPNHTDIFSSALEPTSFLLPSGLWAFSLPVECSFSLAS